MFSSTSGDRVNVLHSKDLFFLQLEISVRRLREKFHGKISIDKAALLMRRYGNDHRRIAMEIVLMKDRGINIHLAYT